MRLGRARKLCRRLGFREASRFTAFQNLLRVDAAEQLDQLRDYAGPAGLMASSQAGAVIAVEIFVEQNVILPLRIGLELLRTSKHWPLTRPIPQENPLQSIRYFMGNLEQVHQLARAGRTLDLEVVTVIQIKRQQSADQQRVHRHPYRTAPVRVPSEHAGV